MLRSLSVAEGRRSKTRVCDHLKVLVACAKPDVYYDRHQKTASTLVEQMHQGMKVLERCNLVNRALLSAHTLSTSSEALAPNS